MLETEEFVRKVQNFHLGNESDAAELRNSKPLEIKNGLVPNLAPTLYLI